MPIKPSPFILRCRSCKWKKRMAPRSDALVEGIDIYMVCPKCQSKELEMEPERSWVFDLLRKKAGN